jgi:hypothetical protein
MAYFALRFLRLDYILLGFIVVAVIIVTSCSSAHMCAPLPPVVSIMILCPDVGNVVVGPRRAEALLKLDDALIMCV